MAPTLHIIPVYFPVVHIGLVLCLLMRPQNATKPVSFVDGVKNGFVIFLSQSPKNSRIHGRKKAREMDTKVATSVDEINAAIQIVVHPLAEIITLELAYFSAWSQ